MLQRSHGFERCLRQLATRECWPFAWTQAQLGKPTCYYPSWCHKRWTSTSCKKSGASTAPLEPRRVVVILQACSLAPCTSSWASLQSLGHKGGWFTAAFDPLWLLLYVDGAGGKPRLLCHLFWTRYPPSACKSTVKAKSSSPQFCLELRMPNVPSPPCANSNGARPQHIISTDLLDMR